MSIDIEKLREMERAATPGPWNELDGDYSVEGPYFEDGHNCIAITDHCNSLERLGPEQCSANAKLIAVLRNTAPALFDEIMALRAENERLRALKASATKRLVEHLASLRCWSLPVGDVHSTYECGSCWPCSARKAIKTDDGERMRAMFFTNRDPGDEA